MDVSGCPGPGCNLPAEILDRRFLESTDGRSEHASIACVGGHRYLMPIEMLPQRVDRYVSRTSVISFPMRAGERSST